MSLSTLRLFFRYFLFFCMLGIAVLGVCYTLISWYGNKYIFDDITAVPKRRVGLVLGTSKYLGKNRINEFYQTRIDTAAQLYAAGKVDYLVVSGDNHRNNYNEPQQMLNDLVAAGVPAARIQPDYAGFRTLDSVVRMEKIFGHTDYMIISQQFHNQRALFIARAKGHAPIAFSAPNPQTMSMKKVITREFLARVLEVFDLITNKKARFYGKPIAFPKAANGKNKP